MLVGQVLTAKALKNHYDDYWPYVLKDCLEEQPPEPKRHRKYKVVNQLPSPDEYAELEYRRFRTTAQSLISDGYGMVTELANEMHHAFHSMPANIRSSPVGRQREEAFSTLESMMQIVPAEFPEIETVFRPALNTDTRAKRVAEAADMLSSAAAAIREYLNKAEKDEELECLANQLEEDAHALTAIDFPGRYG
jgi:hypothetical protein